MGKIAFTYRLGRNAPHNLNTGQIKMNMKLVEQLTKSIADKTRMLEMYSGDVWEAHCVKCWLEMDNYYKTALCLTLVEHEEYMQAVANSAVTQLNTEIEQYKQALAEAVA